MKNINATTEQDSPDQDDKGKSDDDKSDADGKMWDNEQQQVSSGFEESGRATSSLEAAVRIENTGMATADFEVASPAASPVATSLSYNQTDAKFEQILALIKDMNLKFNDFSSRLDAFESHKTSLDVENSRTFRPNGREENGQYKCTTTA